MDRCLVVDVGSTTTKAVLFRRRGQWEMVRAEAPTTVEAPDLDVSVGLMAALRDLQAKSGESFLAGDRATLPLFATSSAGGGLAMVVTGLVGRVSTHSAEVAALGAGAVLLDTIALDDGRVPWRKVDALRRVRPDLLLFAGGFDGGALAGPVLLAELVREAALTPKLDPGAPLPVLYAGNEDARGYVEEVLGSGYLFRAIENLRPGSDRENLEPARRAILETFHEHVMSHAPGYSGLVARVRPPVLPTPSAVQALVELVSPALPGRLLVIDVGGATTDVFTAENGRVFRTVSANLGMSYSALNVLGSQREFLAELLPDLSFAEVEDRIGEKHVHPTRLPATGIDVRVERALAAAAVRGAVSEHLQLLGNASLSRSDDELSLRTLRGRRAPAPLPAPDWALTGYDLVIGSGGALSHPPRRSVAGLLVDALRPVGAVRLGVDRAFVFPHLGVLSKTEPELALELFSAVGYVPLGTLLGPAGRPGVRRARMRVSGVTATGRAIEKEVPGGTTDAVPLAAGESARLDVRTKGLRLGATRVEATGGAAGLLLDARGRPPVPPRSEFFPETFPLPSPRPEAAREEAVSRGRILVRRELTVPGEVLVRVGDTVESGTLVCRSTRTFPRPFFVEVARELGVDPSRIREHLRKAEGETVEAREPIARRRGKLGTDLVVRSPTAGRVERVLPDGRVVIREIEVPPPEVRPVEAARELSIRPEQLADYLLVAVGDEVDRGQALARRLDQLGFTGARSPIRGRVTHVDLQFGLILVAPLLEQLQVSAALPGEVVEVSPRGAVIAGEGLRIRGIFGVGEEASGPLSMSPDPGAIYVCDDPPGSPGELMETGIAGLVVGGLGLGGLSLSAPPFPMVLLLGFGGRRLPESVIGELRNRAGRPALLDARTELRAGVRRPFLVVL